MKKYLFLLFVLFIGLFHSCSKGSSENEIMIKNTIDTFYKYLNDKNFHKMKEVCSPKMYGLIDIFKSFGKDLVEYKNIDYKKITINGKKANVLISVEDNYGNVVEFEWDLILKDKKWKLNMFYGDDIDYLLSPEDRNFSDDAYIPTDENGDPIIKTESNTN